MPMSSPTPADLPAWERYSRRSLWTVLVLLVLVGAIGLSPLGSVPRLRPLVPVAIVIAVIALRWSARSVGADSRVMRRVFDDELRRQSLALAFRDALIAVMGMQPLLAIGITMWPFAVPAAFMACATAEVGLVTLIASLLIRDR
jgi:hypothetical protein